MPVRIVFRFVTGLLRDAKVLFLILIVSKFHSFLAFSLSVSNFITTFAAGEDSGQRWGATRERNQQARHVLWGVSVFAAPFLCPKQN